MAYSRLEYTYSGGDQTFAINFTMDFLDREHVTVYVEGELDGLGDQVYRDFTWVDDTEIEVTDDLDVDDVVVILRTVPKDALVVDFTTAGAATRDNLIAGYKQNMMALHELLDGRVGDSALVDEIVQGAVSDALTDILAGLALEFSQFDQLYFGFYSPYDSQIEAIVTQRPMTLSTAQFIVDVTANPLTEQDYEIYNDGGLIGTLTIETDGDATIVWEAPGGATRAIVAGSVTVNGPATADPQLRFGFTMTGTTSSVAYP